MVVGSHVTVYTMYSNGDMLRQNANEECIYTFFNVLDPHAAMNGEAEEY
eukprot:COSAG05_NODE_136_length_16902_cov_21.052312_6_plen_49_part_00